MEKRSFSVFFRLMALSAAIIFGVVFVIILAFSSLLSYYSKQATAQKSMLILENFQSNVDQSVLMSTRSFVSSDIAKDTGMTRLFFLPLDNELSQLAVLSNKLQQYCYSNSYFHSIYIYYEENDVVVSNNSVQILQNGKYANHDLDWLIFRQEQLPTQWMVMRDFKHSYLLEESNKADVLSYQAQFPLNSLSGQARGTIVINLNIDKIYNSASFRGEGDKNFSSEHFGEILILNEAGMPIIPKDGEGVVFDTATQVSFWQELMEDTPSGFTTKIDEEKYYVYYTQSNINNWKYVNLVPQKSNAPQQRILLISGLFIAFVSTAVSFVTFYFASKNIYHPISSLITQSASLQKELLGNKTTVHPYNEQEIIRTMDALVGKVKSLQGEISQFKPERKTSFLTMVFRSKNVAEKEIDRALSHLNFEFIYPLFTAITVAVVEEVGSTEPKAVIYHNVGFMIESLELDDSIRLASDSFGEGVSVLINHGSLSTVHWLAHTITEYVEQRWGLRAVVGIGDSKDTLLEVSTSYLGAENAVKYGFVYSDTNVFYAKYADYWDKSPEQLSDRYLKRLDAALCTGAVEDIEEAIQAIFHQLHSAGRDFSYNNIQVEIFSVMRLFNEKKVQFALRSEDLMSEEIAKQFNKMTDIHTAESMFLELGKRFYHERIKSLSDRVSTEVKEIQ